jgi:4'-phosphopantetheinyl transferase
MPLLETRQLNEHTILGIWTLTESIDDLKQVLPTHVKPDEKLQQSHIRRQKEWLASRILVYELLKEFTSEPMQLFCNAHGKPVFEEDKYHISITHSPELIAVLLSDKYEVGIDVELISPKALRVAHKFLTDVEFEQTGNQIETTCLYWSAKETLYKLYSYKQLIFKENLLLQPSDSNNMLVGQVKTENFSKLYQVNFERIHHHILTYSIDNTTNN